MIAVLTGDIVNSTKLSESEYQLVTQSINGCCEVLKQKFNAKWELYRGDGFQVSVATPEKSMLCAILLKTGLRKIFSDGTPIDMTLSIGLGNQTVHSEKLGTSFGSAFVLSGQGLDHTPKGDLTIHIGEEFGVLSDTLSITTRFISHFLSQLSQKQAEVLYYYVLMSYPEQQVIAAQLSTSRQNISKHLSRAGAELIKDYLLYFEEQLAQAVT